MKPIPNYGRRVNAMQYGLIGAQKVEKARKRKAMKKMKEQKVVGLIPARGGSKGIRRKNIVKIAGYPMIAHSILALKVAGIKDVYVSTDDAEIKKIAQTYGARVVDRPSELAMDSSSTEEAIGHFLKTVPCDVVVMVQCTSPMLRPIEIQNGLNQFLAAPDLDSMFSAVVTNDMLLWDKDMNPINYNPRMRGRRQDRRDIVLWETGGFYIFTRKIFEQTKCRLGGVIGWSEVKFW
jgi:CMP-N,N'-diacetyllegionaminic acid synthase